MKEDICKYCADGGHCEWWCKGESFEVSKRVKEALAKQIPQKIVYHKGYYGTPYHCPVCDADQNKVEFISDNGTFPSEEVSYCWACGNALDWSEVKE